MDGSLGYFHDYNLEQITIINDAIRAIWHEADYRHLTVNCILNGAREMAMANSGHACSDIQLRMWTLTKLLSTTIQSKLLLMGDPSYIDNAVHNSAKYSVGKVYLLRQGACDLNWLTAHVTATVIALLACVARDKEGRPLKQITETGKISKGFRNVMWRDYHDVRALTAHIADGLCRSQTLDMFGRTFKGALGIGGQHFLAPPVAQRNKPVKAYWARKVTAEPILWDLHGSNVNLGGKPLP